MESPKSSSSTSLQSQSSISPSCISTSSSESTKKSRSKRRITVAHSKKGTKKLTRRLDKKAEANWFTFGQLVAMLTFAMQNAIETAPARFKKNIKKPNPSKDLLDERFNTCRIFRDFGCLIEAGRYPQMTKSKARTVNLWVEYMRHSWGHNDYVYLLKFPRNYLTATILMAELLNRPDIVKKATYRLEEAGLKVRAVLPSQ